MKKKAADNKMKIWPVTAHVKELPVKKCWAVIRSEAAQFYIEDLVLAVEKNYRLFHDGGGEGWTIVGLFPSAQEAATAAAAWIREPGAQKIEKGKSDGDYQRQGF